MATTKNSNYLYSGTAWNIDRGATQGTSVILTYSYVTSLPVYYAGYTNEVAAVARPSALAHDPSLVVSPPADTSGWFDLARVAWSNVAGIAWAQPPSGVTYGDMTLGFVDPNPAFIESGGTAFFPSSALNKYGTAGDVWIATKRYGVGHDINVTI